MTDTTLEAVLELTKLVDQIDSRLAALEVNQAQEVEAEAVDTWPNKRDEYWTVDEKFESIEFVWIGTHQDRAALARGRVFRTKEESEKADLLDVAMNELKVAAEKAWAGDKRSFDLVTKTPMQYFASYGSISGEWSTTWHSNDKTPGLVYFPTDDLAIEAHKAVDAKYPGALR